MYLAIGFGMLMSGYGIANILSLAVLHDLFLRRMAMLINTNKYLLHGNGTEKWMTVRNGSGCDD